MSARRKRKLPVDPVAVHVDDLSHDGRGVARLDGKAVFIDGALPGEDVEFVYTAKRRKHDEGRVHKVVKASLDRVEPRCLHAAICGGCSLQHMAPSAQISAKQQVLLDNLERIGDVQPKEVLAPLTGALWGYRYKARLGVRHVRKKGRVLVGFREKRSSFLADLSACEVLHTDVGKHLYELAKLIQSLSISAQIPQIEVAMGDDDCALVFRVLEAPSSDDMQALKLFAQQHNFHVYLQPKGPDTVSLLWPQASDLTYRLPAHDIALHFLPTDFTQINPDINRKMIDQALALLEPQANDAVLDLFCGLGNFTLPLARHVSSITGVEGDAALVERARGNAQVNDVKNAEFHVADLARLVGQESWLKTRYDKLLIDPPRSGAAEVMPYIGQLAPERIVYVSCHPGSLARDAGMLVNEQGYTLEAAGVMDMFPHTAHVESIALFVR